MTDKLILAYLRASRFGLFFEELPGVFLAVWRFVVVCRSVGLWLKTMEEFLLVTQLFFSLLMLGFQLCNIKEYLRLAEEQIKQERKLERAVQGASTELDTFAGVTSGEIMLVLRLRNMLGDSLKRLGHRAADLMLLRFARFNGGGQEEEGANDELVAMSTGALVTASFARREEVGADVVQERILRDNMVRSFLPHPAHHFCRLLKRCSHVLLFAFPPFAHSPTTPFRTLRSCRYLGPTTCISGGRRTATLFDSRRGAP